MKPDQKAEDRDSVGKARAWAAEELRAAGVDAPMLTADLMLGLVLQWDRVRVLTHPEAALSETQSERFAVLVGRRIRGEPFQYLAGEKEFYGHKFTVTPSVLIPRPETEILVEKALELAKDFPSRTLRFADVGTGSGCILISLLLASSSFTGTGVDYSLDALRVARDNAAFHNVTERLRLVCADLLECIPPQPIFDFILSNPPYCAEAESNTLPATVREYEPHLALFGGTSGLQIVERLISQALPRLKPGGYFLTEIGTGQSNEVAQLIVESGFTLEEIAEDLQRIPRCVVARKRSGRADG
jgi:release factor glutamine methyltransferase